MSPITLSHISDLPRLADMADMAAFVCGSALTPRIRPLFVGGNLASSRCHCCMAAANTVLPAAKSANHPASRRQTP